MQGGKEIIEVGCPSVSRGGGSTWQGLERAMPIPDFILKSAINVGYSNPTRRKTKQEYRDLVKSVVGLFLNYSLFIPRKPCSPLILNVEPG